MKLPKGRRHGNRIRVTVKAKVLVPALPSVADTSLMERDDGGFPVILPHQVAQWLAGEAAYSCVVQKSESLLGSMEVTL